MIKKYVNNKTYLAVLIGISLFGVIAFSTYALLKKHASASPVAESSRNQAPTPPSNSDELHSTTSPDVAQEIKAAPDTVDVATVPILMYHHIKINIDEKNKIEVGLDLPPDQFELEMKTLVDSGYQSVSLPQIFNSTQDKKVAITFDDGYKDVAINAYPIMKKYGFVGTAFIITDSVGKDDYMTWDDIRMLHEAGWEIGSHTSSHPDLSKSRENKVIREVTDSKSKIEEEIGTTVSTFCYPSGKYNDTVVQNVANAGYKYAVTTVSGTKNSSANPLRLKRVRINGTDLLNQFKGKVIK